MADGGGTLFVVSAPSGAGKGTLIRRALDELDGIAFSVSWTTRAPRPGERDGVDYHFCDEATFREKVRRGDFLEWAEVHGHLYGTGRAEVEERLARGLDVLLDIDVQGAAQVRASGFPAAFVFILPPSPEVLSARLRGRGTESEESLRRRLADAREEVPRWREFDWLVLNDDLEDAVREFVGVFRAVRASRERRGALAARIEAAFREWTP